MGKCVKCGKETDGSAVIYQADLVGSRTVQSASSNLFADTTSTTEIKTYQNVTSGPYFCCKECRSEKGMWRLWLVSTVIGAGLTWLCWLGGPWRETGVGTFIQVICVLGIIVFGMLTIAGVFATLSNLIYPYGSVESTLIAHLNLPQNNNGHVYMTKAEGDKLKPVR